MEKVRYVQRVRKGERIHLYFRKDGFRQSLEAQDGDLDAIRAEVDAILQVLEEVAQAKRPKPGTVGGMLEAYRTSADFLGLAGSTQAEYGRLIDELKADCGDDLLSSVDPAWLNDLRDAWAPRGYKAANDRRQVLKNALAPAIADDRIEADPFAKVGKLKRPHDMGESHPYWEDAEVEAFLALALERKMPGLARAVALGRWGGFRRGTICAIPLNARLEATDDDGNRVRRLFWMTEKRRVLCDKREDPRLTRLLAETPNRALTIAYNDRDQPWKERALNQAIERLVVTLAKEGKVRTGLTPHGLRHARGVELALAGASDAEIMAQLEHATAHQAQLYRRQAQRRRLADAGQDRIDSVVELKAARKERAERV
jgi:integrase